MLQLSSELVPETWTHEDRVKQLMASFKKLLDGTLGGVGFADQFENNPEEFTLNDAFGLKEIYTGYPSDLISSPAEVCVKSNFLKEHLRDMPKTKNTCLKAHTELINVWNTY